MEQENKKNVLKDTFAIYKGEFGKIIWPNRIDLVKQTGTVLVTSLLFGVIIFGMDTILASAYQMILLAFN